MIFPYVSYDVEPSSAIPSGTIFRPEVLIRIIGPRRSFQVSGLLDTGADQVCVSASLARRLGIDLGGVAEKVFAAGGHESDVWPATLEIEIILDGDLYRWRAEIGFIAGDDDPPIAYLGHAGFLEFFRATFDGETRTIELLPGEKLTTSLESRR